MERAAAFVTWYEEEVAEEGCPEVLRLARKVREHGASAFENAAHSHSSDRLVSDFYGFFLEEDAAALPEVPVLNVQGYVDLFDALTPHIASGIAELLNFAIAGRPVGPSRVEPYHSDDGVSRVSWWTFDEVRRLRVELPKRDFRTGPAMELMSVLHDALDSAYAAGGGLVITVF